MRATVSSTVLQMSLILTGVGIFGCKTSGGGSGRVAAASGSNPVIEDSCFDVVRAENSIDTIIHNPKEIERICIKFDDPQYSFKLIREKNSTQETIMGTYVADRCGNDCFQFEGSNNIRIDLTDVNGNPGLQLLRGANSNTFQLVKQQSSSNGEASSSSQSESATSRESNQDSVVGCWEVTSPSDSCSKNGYKPQNFCVSSPDQGIFTFDFEKSANFEEVPGGSGVKTFEAPAKHLKIDYFFPDNTNPLSGFRIRKGDSILCEFDARKKQG